MESIKEKAGSIAKMKIFENYYKYEIKYEFEDLREMNIDAIILERQNELEAKKKKKSVSNNAKR